jgi:hypothetical protein
MEAMIMNQLFRYFFAVLIAAQTLSLHAEEKDDLYAIVYGNMSRLNNSRELSPEMKFEKLAALYKENISNLNPRSDTDTLHLHAMFRAADLVASYAMVVYPKKMGKYVERMRSVYEILQERNEVLTSEASSLYGSYIAERDFAKAKALKSKTSLLGDEKLPHVEITENLDKDKPAVIELESTGRSFFTKAVQMQSGYKIIIVSGCHISRDAAKEVEDNPALNDIFKKYGAIWLQPADRTLSAESVREWNKSFPDQQLVISYRNSAWKGIDFARIPSFYLYKDGKLISQQHGWKYGDHGKMLIETLRRAGIFNL